MKQKQPINHQELLKKLEMIENIDDEDLSRNIYHFPDLYIELLKEIHEVCKPCFEGLETKCYQCSDILETDDPGFIHYRSKEKTPYILCRFCNQEILSFIYGI